jgi:hypothetical protein
VGLLHAYRAFFFFSNDWRDHGVVGYSCDDGATTQRRNSLMYDVADLGTIASDLVFVFCSVAHPDGLNTQEVSRFFPISISSAPFSLSLTRMQQ